MLHVGTQVVDLVGQDPLALPPAEWPERAVGMGTVPERWATWQQFWSE